MKTTLQLAAAILMLTLTVGCSQKQCDTHLQQMAHSDVCDDDYNNARLRQMTADQKVLNDLDTKIAAERVKQQ